MDSKTIGELIKETRKKQKFTQAEAAAYLGIGTRFLSDLENGKPTIQLEKALRVLNGIGLNVLIIPKSNYPLNRYIEDHLNEK